MMARSSKVVALVSGGVDSAALIHMLLGEGRQTLPLYVRCGLRWEPAELRAVRRWLAVLRDKRLGALDVLSVPRGTVSGGHWSMTGQGIPSATSSDAAVYLPGRNVILLSHAMLYAAGHGAHSVAIGTLAGNPFQDATPAFFASLAACASRALGRAVRVLTPLRRLTKAQLITRNPKLPYTLTMSCLRPRRGRHCGRCNKCAERRRAFRRARVPDPTRYVR